MAYGLGIDTGGTYTDAAIYDFDAGDVIATAKSITVKEDLTLGIDGALGQLEPRLLERVEMVSLSTTLATNACVEGKGGRALLVLIGCDPRVIEWCGAEYGLPPAEEIHFVAGGHDMTGKVVSEPDWQELQARIADVAPRFDAYAVVELWGVRNAEFEIEVGRLIRERTGKPVVCGHEITGELNSLKRATSALLNARLLPLTADFLDAVRASLARIGLKAPLVIVRGDGSLMAEEFARTHPVETLLSGPAASVAGGLALTGERDCLIVDMGGTTSDLAIVRGGQPDMTTEGARVGGWQTGIRSILIHTVGLGGDSLIRHNQDNGLDIGPRRAAPLSWMASRWPQVLPVLESLQLSYRRHTHSLAEFFYLVVDRPDPADYLPEETAIEQALRGGPLSLEQLATAVGASIYTLRTERLEQQGRIMRCGVTPTDVMHLTDEFTGWNRRAAELGVDILAFQLSMERKELVARVRTQVKEHLYLAIAEMLLSVEVPHLTGTPEAGPHLRGIAREAFRQNLDDAKPGRLLDLSFRTSATLVGIGAPTHLFLPLVARALQTRFLIPPHAAVANAVGAVTGHVVAVEEVLIKPEYGAAGIDAYFAFATLESRRFVLYDDALAWACAKAEEEALQTALSRGATDPEVTLEVVLTDAPYASSFQANKAPEEVHGEEGEQGSSEEAEAKPERLFIESRVKARAVGRVGAVR